MGKYTVKKLIQANKNIKGANVGILGFTFKENCPDTRNTRIIDIVNELNEYEIYPTIVDPIADADEAKKLYGIEFKNLNLLKDLDALIIATSHDKFKEIQKNDFEKMFKNEKVLIDVKGILNRKEYQTAGYLYWRL